MNKTRSPFLERSGNLTGQADFFCHDSFEIEILIEKVIDRPTQTPLCGFTFATQKPLIKASL